MGSDVGWSDRVLSNTQIDAMRIAGEHGFRYVRLHDCVHNPKVYSEDAQGRSVYSWQGFDARIGAVVDNGMLPVVVLEGMPPPLAAGDDGLSWMNPYPPRDAEAYRKWQSLIRAIVQHSRDRWGDSIHDWYFEVWNEPDAEGYFKGTLEEYLRIYDHAVAGATAADPAIRIGGPGGAGTGWVKPLLEHCRSGRNDATGATGCRVDFVSWHIYTVGVGIPVFDNLRLSLQAVRQALDELPEYRALPTLITEWGCASSPSPVHDRPYDAAFRTLAVREFLDAGITLALPFCLGEGPPHAHEGFQGGLALFTKTTIPKPSFRVFELLNRMVGTRVACESPSDPVGGLACVSEDGKRAWVMLYSLIEKPDHEPYRTQVAVTVANLPPGDWRCQATAIAPGKCDPYLVWEQIGRPETLTREQRAKLVGAGELPASSAVPVQEGRLTLEMDGFSVMLLELGR
jgi:xylan 1,4-beta-xylosidase